MRKPVRPYSDSEKRQITEAVAAAEAGTSGEIVPIVTEVSGEYFWVPPVMGFRLGLAALISAEIVNSLSWPVSWGWTLSFTLAFSFLGYVLGLIPSVARLVIGDFRLASNVQRTAHSFFITEGLVETRDRTGVLILVSRFERRIFILADRGIYSKLSSDYLEKLCAEFSLSAQRDEEVAALCGIIQRVGAELLHHFPRDAEDQNELSNSLRIGGEA